MSRILNQISQAALRHRAGIRRWMPKRLHHLVGTLARRVIQAVEASGPASDGPGLAEAGLAFPEPLRSPQDHRRDTVVLVNDALASGGSERQIVNTLVGTGKRGAVETRLLCWRLEETPELDFYAADLRRAGIDFANVSDQPSCLTEAERARLTGWLDGTLGWVPQDIRNKILRLAGDLVRHRPAVLHGWQDENALVSAFAGLLAGVPRIVVATRNVNPSGFGYHRPFMRTAYQVLARHSEIVFVNNSAVGARDYERWIGLPEGRFSVLYNGVDAEASGVPNPQQRIDARSSLGLPREGRVIGTLIRLNREKRPLLWLAVAARCLQRHPDLRFLMAGDGAMRDTILAEAGRLGIGDRLLMPGAVRPAQRALHAMDVFLLTSEQEGLPNVTLEAGAAGLPVVTTDAGGARETILIGETGLLVAGNDRAESALVAELSEAVCSILEDPQWPERVRHRGPLFVRDSFGVDRMIEETLGCYFHDAVLSQRDR